jgi:hypothetical protein
MAKTYVPLVMALDVVSALLILLYKFDKSAQTEAVERVTLMLQNHESKARAKCPRNAHGRTPLPMEQVSKKHRHSITGTGTGVEADTTQPGTALFSTSSKGDAEAAKV